MSSNTIGTITRILMIFFTLIFFWYFCINIFYVAFTYAFDIPFSFSISLGLFAIFLIFRMFYPKNVFK